MLGLGVLSLGLWRCGSDEETPKSATTKTITSDADSTGHTHTISIPCATITSPTSEGAELTSSSDSGHRHTLAITEAALLEAKAGGTVSVTTSSGSHSHTFSLVAC